jgi:hypothetical protein
VSGNAGSVGRVYVDELLLDKGGGVKTQAGPMGEHGGQERDGRHEGTPTNGDEMMWASAADVLPPQPFLRGTACAQEPVLRRRG